MLTLEEFFNKQHKDIEEVLEDLSSDTHFNLLITEAIREDALTQNLEKIQNRLLQFDVKGKPEPTINQQNNQSQNSNFNNQNNQQQNNNDDNIDNPFATEDNTDNENPFSMDDNQNNNNNNNQDKNQQNNNEEQPDFNIDSNDTDTSEDNFDFGSDENNNDNTDNNGMSPEIDSEQNVEDQKDKLLSNVKQLMQLRDLLEEVLSTTANPEFLKINQHVNKILSSIASIGDSIMDRPDVKEINMEIEQFLVDAVEKTKQKVEELKQENSRKEGGD